MKGLSLSTQEKKIIFLASLGGALEFYDFIIYVVFAPIIGKIFFPQTDALAALLSIYAVFAIGYLIRPLGGVLFSHFGDKYGRKKTFLYSVMLMAIPTVCIGFLPTYQHVGIIASCLLIFFRLLQGLSIGGEIPGALTFTCEHVNAKHRGFVCGIIYACLNLGIILGSFISFLLTSLLSEEQLTTFGWRIPFILGGLLGVVSYFIRQQMTESPLYLAFQETGQQSRVPLFEALIHHWRSILQGVGITIMGAVCINLVFLYMPGYLSLILGYPIQQVNFLTTCNLILYTVLLLIVCWYSDKINKRLPILGIATLGFLCMSYVLFLGLSQQTFMAMFFSLFLFAILSAGISVYPAILIDLFPTSIRYTGLAISYNIAYGLFGGVSPLIATYLIQTTSNILTPSFYLMLSASICLIAIFTIKIHKNKGLAH